MSFEEDRDLILAKIEEVNAIDATRITEFSYNDIPAGIDYAVTTSTPDALMFRVSSLDVNDILVFLDTIKAQYQG